MTRTEKQIKLLSDLIILKQDEKILALKKKVQKLAKVVNDSKKEMCIESEPDCYVSICVNSLMSEINRLNKENERLRQALSNIHDITFPYEMD